MIFTTMYLLTVLITLRKNHQPRCWSFLCQRQLLLVGDPWTVEFPVRNKLRSSAQTMSKLSQESTSYKREERGYMPLVLIIQHNKRL